MKHYIEKQLAHYANHSLLLGEVTSGKTYAIKMELENYVKNENKIYLIDFENEFNDCLPDNTVHRIPICSLDSVCLFEFTPNDEMLKQEQLIYQFEYYFFCTQRINVLINLFERPVTQEEKRILLRTVRQLLHQNGITEEHYQPQEQYPNLDDFLMVLEKENKVLYEEIKQVKGSFTARKTTLPLTNGLDYLAFDTKHLNQREKAYLYHTILLILIAQIRESKTEVVLIIDGLDELAMCPSIAEELVLLLKSIAKKHGTICLFTHPSLTQLMEQYGEGMLGNCNTFFLFRQAEKERAAIKEYFDLYEQQISELVSYPIGQALAVHSWIVSKVRIPKK